MVCFANIRFLWPGIFLIACGVTLGNTSVAAEPPEKGPSEVHEATAPLQLTIQKAVRIARENNPVLHQAKNQVESSSLVVAQRRADFAPDLAVDLIGTERFDKEPEPLSDSGDGRNYETVSGALSSNVNLFNGFGDISALRGAEWELGGSQDSFSREEQTLIFSTVSEFLQALSDRELIRVRAENLEGNRRQLEQIEALYRAGNRPISDLYQQQAETASAELDLLVAERNYVVTKLQLLQTIGLPPATLMEPEAPSLDSLETALVEKAVADQNRAGISLRLDVQAKEKQIEAAREQVAVAQAGFWPTLNLSASLGSDFTSLDKNTSFRSQFFDDNVGGTLGINMSYPIFDRQQTRNQVAQARIREQDAVWSLVQQQLQAQAEIGQSLHDFGTAQKLIGVTERRLIAARQGLAAVEERYRVGAATLVELTQARAQFVEAGYERVKARYGLITQGVAIAYYQGDWEQMRTLLTLWENSQ